jgi:tetratricopeptide (TPR) repeat protein
MGIVNAQRGNYDSAVRTLDHARKMFQAIGDRLRSAWVEINLAETFIAACRYDQARELLENCARVHARIGERRGEALATLRLGELHLAQGEPKRAVERLRRSHRLLRQHRPVPQHHLARCLTALAAAEAIAVSPSLVGPSPLPNAAVCGVDRPDARRGLPSDSDIRVVYAS